MVNLPVSYNHDKLLFVWNTASDYVEVYDVVGYLDGKPIILGNPAASFHLWDYLPKVRNLSNTYLSSSRRYFEDACKEWAKHWKS